MEQGIAGVILSADSRLPNDEKLLRKGIWGRRVRRVRRLLCDLQTRYQPALLVPSSPFLPPLSQRFQLRPRGARIEGLARPRDAFADACGLLGEPDADPRIQQHEVTVPAHLSIEYPRRDLGVTRRIAPRHLFA